MAWDPQGGYLVIGNLITRTVRPPPPTTETPISYYLSILFTNNHYSYQATLSCDRTMQVFSVGGSVLASSSEVTHTSYTYPFLLNIAPCLSVYVVWGAAAATATATATAYPD